MRAPVKTAALLGATAALAICLSAAAPNSSATGGAVFFHIGLTEENLPAEDLQSATPTPPASGEQATPGASAIPETPAAAVPPAPGENQAQAEATPTAAPTELPPLDVGSVQPKLRISDSPLTPLIEQASSPAFAASVRVTEQARKDILKERPDDAIHALGRALSIDPSNAYAYFYLGRAWLSRKDYGQALTFLKRAEVGFANNGDWLGETLTFEGLAYEQQNDAQAALAAYQQALQAEPGNLMARVGYSRLVSAMEPAPTEPGSVSTTEAAPPPGESTPSPPPDSAPPSPAY